MRRLLLLVVFGLGCLMSTLAGAQQDLSGSEIRQLLVGKRALFSNGSMEFATDGTVVTLTTAGKTFRGTYVISGNSLCRDYGADGGKKCYRVTRGSNDFSIVDAANVSLRFTVASVDAPREAPPKAASRLGPSFPCNAPSVATQPLAQLICANDELALIELSYVIVYQALRQSLNDQERRALAIEADRAVLAMSEACGIPKSGQLSRLPSEREVSCLRQYLATRRANLLQRTKGDALEEAKLTPSDIVAIQRLLQKNGLIPQDAMIDGVFGPVTRAGIVELQRRDGLRETGFASASMVRDRAPSAPETTATGVPPVAADRAQAEVSRPAPARELTGPPYNDPHSYCRAVSTIDEPDERYRGPNGPAAVVNAFYKASDISKAEAEGRPVSTYGIFWRCRDGEVYACESAMSPSCIKADANRSPTDAMIAFCRETPGAAMPRAVLGTARMMALDWRCLNRTPMIVRSFPVDARGFPTDAWRRVP